MQAPGAVAERMAVLIPSRFMISFERISVHVGVGQPLGSPVFCVSANDECG